MRLDEVQKLVEGKSFKSTACGGVYKFRNANILLVNSDKFAPYSILESNNWFLLDHGHLLAEEDLILKVDNVRFPIVITFYRKSDLDFYTTFIEE